MIERKDILPIPYLKKAVFTGSYEGMRFRFAMVKREVPSEEEETGKEIQVLEVTAWEGPYGFDATSPEKMQSVQLEFSEKGIQEGVDWLNKLWESEPRKWKEARTNW